MNEQTKHKIISLSGKAGIRQIHEQVPEATITEIREVCNTKLPEPTWSNRTHRSLKKDLKILKQLK